MKVSMELKFIYDSSAKAEAIKQALQTDNGHVEYLLDGEELHIKVREDAVSTMLNTFEDLMTCLSLAEKILGSKNENRTNRHI
jgi:hypothetical protein